MDMKILIAIFFKLKEDSMTRGHKAALVKSMTRGHKAALVKPYCRLDNRKFSFSQRTINDWNNVFMIE